MREFPNPGETALLNDKYDSGMLLRDNGVSVGSKCGTIKFSEHVLLAGNNIEIVSGTAIKIRGDIILEGEVLDEDTTLTPAKMRQRLIGKLRGLSFND